MSTHHSGTVKSAPPGGWPCILVSETHPLPRDSKKCPAWWVDMLQWRTHSPTRRGTPTVHGRWEALHGGQGSISLEYQTCTSPYPFDTPVTGLGWGGYLDGGTQSHSPGCGCMVACQQVSHETQWDGFEQIKVFHVNLLDGNRKRSLWLLGPYSLKRKVIIR